MSQIRAELNAGVGTDTRCKVTGNLVQVRHRYQWHNLVGRIRKERFVLKFHAARSKMFPHLVYFAIVE